MLGTNIDYNRQTTSPFSVQVIIMTLYFAFLYHYWAVRISESKFCKQTIILLFAFKMQWPNVEVLLVKYLLILEFSTKFQYPVVFMSSVKVN